jgi:hypothetical protein
MAYLRQYLTSPVSEDAHPDHRIEDAAFLHIKQSFRLHAASVLNQWAETSDDDLDPGETLADRLFVLLAQAVSEDSYRQFDDNEQEMYGAVLASAAEYMLLHDVAPEDAQDLLDSWSDDAAIRVRDTLLESLPEGDTVPEEVTRFAFGSSSPVSLDAVYKDVVAFQNGKKIIRRKRISGLAKVLTPKQKAALAEIRKKSHTAAANRARNKSVKARIKSGIGMKRKPA